MRWLLALCVVPLLAFADSSSLNLQLPSGGGNYQSDKFRAGDLDCSNAIGGSTNVEFGVTGIVGTDDGTIGTDSKDIGVYARIIVPLDGPRERINCNTLYQLELQKKRLEVQKLKEELNNLRNLQKGFEN
jgi:hypothetical protein